MGLDSPRPHPPPIPEDFLLARATPRAWRTRTPHPIRATAKASPAVLGGQPRPGLNRATAAERVITIRSWEELKDDPNVWRGTAREMIRAVMVDPEQPMDIRLHCAAALEKREPDGADKPKRQYDIKLLTEREKSVFLHLFCKTTSEPPSVERDPALASCYAWLAEDGGDDHAPPPPRPPRQAAAEPPSAAPALLPAPAAQTAPAPSPRGGIAGAEADGPLHPQVSIVRPPHGVKCARCKYSSQWWADSPPKDWRCVVCSPPSNDRGQKQIVVVDTASEAVGGKSVAPGVGSSADRSSLG